MERGEAARNPYTPGMGARPPLLAGREEELEYFDELLHQLSAGGTQKHLILAGLRGVGKTVLLNEFEVKCEQKGWLAEVKELSRDSRVGPIVAKAARKALLQLSAKHRTLEGVKRAMHVIKNFSVTIGEELSFQVDLDTQVGGIADSGDLHDDLRDLLVEVGQVSLKHGTGFALILDEIQFLEKRELEALIMGLHRTEQKGLPVALVAGGLPLLPELTGKAKTYAERGFEFREIGALDANAAALALREPARRQGAEWTDDAIRRVIELTQGYPYFIQEYGRHIWKLGSGTHIDVDDVVAGEPLVSEYLDSNFFSQRIGKLPDLERNYMSAMAFLGDGPQKSGEVADVLRRKAQTLSSIRARLLDEALIYSPRRGFVDFTVPLCSNHIRRHYPLPTESL